MPLCVCLYLILSAYLQGVNLRPHQCPRSRKATAYWYIYVIFLCFIRLQVTVGGVQCNSRSPRRVCPSIKEWTPVGDFSRRGTGSALQWWDLPSSMGQTQRFCPGCHWLSSGVCNLYIYICFVFFFHLKSVTHWYSHSSYQSATTD